MSNPSGESSERFCKQDARDLLCWSLLASVALLIALAGPLLAGRVYTGDDLGAFHLPARAFYAEQLARGEPFDWMPHLYGGFYLTGEGQAGTYHPLHLLLYRFLPLPTALGCEWLAAYPFMLAGTWLFLRRRLRRPEAAMFGSLLCTFSGFNLLHFVHPNAVAIVAHIPWLLWAIDIVMVDSRRSKVALAQAGIALLTASELLLGYPQYVWFSLLAEAAYTGFLWIDRKHAPRDGCDTCATCDECVGCSGNSPIRVLIAKGTGILLGAVQLLPTIDAFGQSARQSADASFASWGSLHPLNLAQLVAPYLFVDRVLGENTHELGLYAGAVPLVLVVWLLLHWRRLGSLGSLAWATAGFGALALLLALGRYAPLYRLQTWLPLIGCFRLPCRYVALFHLAIAVLAAIGFGLLVDENRRRRLDCRPAAAAFENEDSPDDRSVGPGWLAQSAARQGFWKEFEALWALVAVSVAVAVAGLISQGNHYVAAVPAVLVGPLLVAAATVLVVAAARGVRGAMPALILFAAADIGYYGLSYTVGRRTAPLHDFVAAAVTPPGATGDRVVASPIRFDAQGPRTGNQMTLKGWHRADGYAGLEPRRQLDYGSLPALRAAGVRWVRRNGAEPAADGLVSRDANWLEVPRPLPRVRLVTQAKASESLARDIGEISVDSTVLCEVPFALPAAAPGKVAVVAERPGRLEVKADCPAPQLLVVADSYHSGWQATVDGDRQGVLRVNGDFMGCLVPAGEHRIALEFRPRSLALGRLGSCAGLGLLLICLLVGLHRPTLPKMEDHFA